jgi:hypothetical protein
MPRTSNSSKKQTFGFNPPPAPAPAPASAPSPNIIRYEQSQPSLFGSITQGFGLGMGSSIARNIFESKPSQPLVIREQPVAYSQQPEKGETKVSEFIQCMEKTYNNYYECVHHLDAVKSRV